MKRMFSLLFLAALAACPALADVTVISDDFNDGVRNRALWRMFNKYGGRFVEKEGRLFAYSGAVEPPSSFHFVSWNVKPVVDLIAGDILEMEALVRLPPVALETNPNARVYVNMNLLVPSTNKYRGVMFQFLRNHSGRTFTETIFKANSSLLEASTPLPSLSNAFVMKMRYNTANGKLSFWSRATADLTWTRLKVMDLNQAWGFPLGRALTLEADIQFGTSDTRVDQARVVYIDDFKLTRFRPAE